METIIILWCVLLGSGISKIIIDAIRAYNNYKAYHSIHADRKYKKVYITRSVDHHNW